MLLVTSKNRFRFPAISSMQNGKISTILDHSHFALGNYCDNESRIHSLKSLPNEQPFCKIIYLGYALDSTDYHIKYVCNGKLFPNNYIA